MTIADFLKQHCTPGCRVYDQSIEYFVAVETDRVWLTKANGECLEVETGQGLLKAPSVWRRGFFPNSLTCIFHTECWQRVAVYEPEKTLEMKELIESKLREAVKKNNELFEEGNRLLREIRQLLKG